MNLAIINHTTKEYQAYIYVTPDQENFLNGLVSKILTKNNSQIMVQAKINFEELNVKGYIKNDTLVDRLVSEYNSKINDNEEILKTWKKF